MVAHSVVAQRLIAAETQRVWTVVTDLEGAPDVIGSIVAIERLEGDGWTPGVRWRETRKLWGRAETEEMSVEAVDEPRSTTVRSTSRGTEYTTVFHLEEEEGGTRVTIDFSAETPHPGPAQRIGWMVFGKAGMRATQRALEQDLEDIAAAVEDDGA